jgi:hypothetical protein
MAITEQSDADNVLVPDGFSLQSFATGLTFPTAITFSNDKVWVSESGATPDTVPQVVQIGPDGHASSVLSSNQLPEGVLAGPITDITFHDGEIWLTHRQVGANDWLVGAISKFDPANPVDSFTTVLTNLPSTGDHFTEEIKFDDSGRAFFAQGSATNASVVGPDNELVTGWLSQFPNFHDFAPQDVVLNGTEFHAPIAVPGLNPENQVTAPFMPFGSGPIAPGTVVPAATPETPQEGMIAGNAAIYSFDPSADDPASTLRLEGDSEIHSASALTRSIPTCCSRPTTVLMSGRLRWTECRSWIRDRLRATSMTCSLSRRAVQQNFSGRRISSMIQIPALCCLSQILCSRSASCRSSWFRSG